MLMSENTACPICSGTQLKYKLARAMTHGRQQLLWRKQVTVVRFCRLWLPDRPISQWCSAPNADRHVVSHRRSVRRRRFAPMSLLFVAPDAYSRSFCKFSSAGKVNSFLSLNWVQNVVSESTENQRFFYRAMHVVQSAVLLSYVNVRPSVRPSVRSATPVLLDCLCMYFCREYIHANLSFLDGVL